MKNVGGPKLVWPIPYRFRISVVFLPNLGIVIFILNEKSKGACNTVRFPQDSEGGSASDFRRAHV